MGLDPMDNLYNMDSELCGQSILFKKEKENG